MYYGLTRVGLQSHAPALLFERIKGADFPMLTNLLGTDRRFLAALGIDKWSDFNEEWCRRTERLVPPRIVRDAPCQEVVIEGDGVLFFQNEVAMAEFSRTTSEFYAGPPVSMIPSRVPSGSIT